MLEDHRDRRAGAARAARPATLPSRPRRRSRSPPRSARSAGSACGRASTCRSPDRPMTTKTSPGRTSSDTSRTAATQPVFSRSSPLREVGVRAADDPLRVRAEDLPHAVGADQRDRGGARRSGSSRARARRRSPRPPSCEAPGQRGTVPPCGGDDKRDTLSIPWATSRRSSSSLPASARAVVIGAGIVGNSLAYHLARLGWRDLVLLDKGPLPNPGGSTGHASNFIFPVDHSKEMTALTLESVRQYRELGVFTECGGIEVARTEERMQELRRRMASAKSWGIEPVVARHAGRGQGARAVHRRVGDPAAASTRPSVGVVDSLRAGHAHARARAGARAR